MPIFLFIKLAFVRFFSPFLSLISTSSLTLIFLVTLAVLLGGSFLVAKPWREIGRLSRREWIILAIILLAAGYFRIQQPQDYFIFHDEESYLHQAQMIANGQGLGHCEWGDWEGQQLHCWENHSGVPSKKEGYPFLLALPLLIFGKIVVAWPAIINIIIGTLTVVWVFLLAREWHSTGAGWAAATFLALLPEHIKWSATLSLEVPALFFIILGLLMWTFFEKTKRYSFWLSALAVFNYLAMIRPEMILLFFLVMGGGTLWHLCSTRAATMFALRNLMWRRGQVLITVGLSMVTTWNIILSFLTRGRYQSLAGYYQIPGIYSWQFFKENFPSLFFYHADGHNYVVWILLVMALVGTYWLGRSSLKKTVMLWSVVVSLIIVHTAYYFGGYQKFGILHDRFALIWWGLLVVPAGIGWDKIVNKGKSWRSAAGVLILLLTLTAYVWFGRAKFFPSSPQQTPWQERHTLLDFQKDNLSCLYISPLPFREMANGFDAISPALFDQKWSKQDYRLITHSCIVMPESYLCSGDASHSNSCDVLLKKYSWREVSRNDLVIWQLIP